MIAWHIMTPFIFCLPIPNHRPILQSNKQIVKIILFKLFCSKGLTTMMMMFKLCT